MANRIFDLPETKGAFQLKGIVTGTEKENFYRELRTRSNREMRIVNFGVEYTDGETLYVNLQGMEQDNVYFTKKADMAGGKPEVAKVPWTDRFTYNREGFRLIGKNIGVKKKVDSEGKTVNDKKILSDFDACKEVHENLKDGASVFIRGDIDYSSYTDDNNNKRTSIKLVPGQISLCSDIDFDDEKFTQQNDFNQVIIFMGISQEKNDNGAATGRYIVSAKIVTYSTIEDVEFIIENEKLAKTFKKNLKPYNAIKVSGQIVVKTSTETVEDEDEWGESDKMERVTAPSRREFIITGAKGSTVDKELYTEANVTEALAKIANANKAANDFGSTDTNDGWGDTSSLDDADDDDAWDD